MILKVLFCVHIYEPNYICGIDILVIPFIPIPFTDYSNWQRKHTGNLK